MSAGSSQFDKAVLSLLLTNATANLVGIGDAAGLQPSATAGGVYISLHSAAPGKDGTQATSELSYTGYARVAVPRAATAWQVAGASNAVGTAWNLTALYFPTVTGGPEVTATHVGIGTTASGTGYLLLSAPLSASVVLTASFIPILPSAALVVTAD